MVYKKCQAQGLLRHRPSGCPHDLQHPQHIRGWSWWSDQLFFLFVIFSLTPADLHLVPGLTGTWQRQSGRRMGRAQDGKRKTFYNILRYSKRRSQRFFFFFFFSKQTNKKVPAGSQSYIYATQTRKPSRPPGAGSKPKHGYCVQATGWLRDIVRAWPCLGRGGWRGKGEYVPMTPWGVTTIGPAGKPGMPGAQWAGGRSPRGHRGH